MRRGILSDAAIRRMHPESFVPDSLTHQPIYHDSVDIHRHGLSGIKRPRLPMDTSKAAHEDPCTTSFCKAKPWILNSADQQGNRYLPACGPRDPPD